MFKRCLGKGHKALTLDDVQKGMKTELRYDMGGSYVPGVKEMTKTIRHAFKVSSELAPPSDKPGKAKAKAKSSAKIDSNQAVSPKKGNKKDEDAKGKSVDKREFHAFLVAMRFLLELCELFETMDGACDDDQKLSCREVLKGKDKLEEWEISEAMVREKFTGVDPWVAHMKFDEFTEWVMGIRLEAMSLHLDDSDDEEVQYHAARKDLVDGVDVAFKDLGAESDLNKMKVRETFASWDSDGSGGISWEELAAVMKELNPTFTENKVKLLFEVADANKDGLIDFDEFLTFIFM